MKHTAIYLRVSTRRQDTKSQEPELLRWAGAQDGEVRWYRDSFTGRTMDRPGWQKLQAAIDRGEVERVCCWRLDRLGRTARGLTSLFADLQTHGVGLVSLKDGIDLGTAAGRMLANVLASIAQFETELRAERVLAGQEAAWKAGKTWGGSKKGRRLHVTAEAAEAVKRLHSEGKPIAAIGRAVGLSRPTIYTLIEN